MPALTAAPTFPSLYKDCAMRQADLLHATTAAAATAAGTAIAAGATVPAAAAGSAAANEQDQDENPPAVKAIVAVVAHNRFLLFQIFHSHTIAGTTRR